MVQPSDLLERKIAEWKRWDKNEATLNALQGLVNENNFPKLEKLMLKRITFGTAGLRGKMGLGYGCMNDLVIIQTAQGWLKHLESEKKDSLRESGIVVGYDGRHNSRRWGEITAAVFAHAGYPVKLFGNVSPTPFVSFAIAKYGCAGGVMVTASHNPKDDNGYKVYDSNCCQIISPVDKRINSLILQHLVPLETSWDTSIIRTSPLVTDPLPQLTEDYVKLVSSTILPELQQTNKEADLLFTHTAMHGVGHPYVQAALGAIGIRISPVEEQKEPDPDFSTVKYPNPEEGESSLDLSFKAAEKVGSILVIANDPDADRFAFAEKNNKSGQWKIFTGNELGALFGWWALHCRKLKNPGESLANIYMMSSTVSSMILKTMARRQGFNFLDTLTGFKWMGNKTIELHSQGKTVLLGYEAEIGFMCVPEIPDKDGISAAAHFTTLCSHVYRAGKQVYEKLAEIYGIYGYHVSRNAYFACSDREIIKDIFEGMRHFDGTDNYPDNILKGKYKIVSIRDLTTGYDSTEPDKKARLPLSPEMITFTFDNGLIITLRTSGTEPKIKYYSELCASPDIKDKEAVRATLNEMVDEILSTFLGRRSHGQHKDE